VLSVLADHTLQTLGIYSVGPFPVVWFGLFGVYLFFLHTSLVLMWSLERRPHTLDFYIRRAFRIYPLAIFASVVVLLLHLPTAGFLGHPFAPAPREPLTVLANLLLIQNLLHRPPIESVMWSLPLEVQMYLVLPMIFVFARKERTLWTMLVLWAVSALSIQAVMPNTTECTIIAAVPFFLCGVIAYVGFMHRVPRLPSWLLLPLIFALALVCCRHPALRNAWVACLLIALLLPSLREAEHNLWVRAGHIIAKYSFGIYLLHQWSLALAFYYLPIRSLMLKLAIEFGSLAILAPLAYHFIEDPLVRMGKRVARRVQRDYSHEDAERGLALR